VTTTNPEALAWLIREEISRVEQAIALVDQEDDHTPDGPWQALQDLPEQVSLERRITVVLRSSGPRIEATALIGDDERVRDVTITGADETTQITQTIPEGNGLYLAVQAYADSYTV
jgi:hypothetical protein